MKDELIYHYCSVESFRAIIQNKIIWLSSIYNLNDYKEIHWIKDKVKKRIDELKDNKSYMKYKKFEKLYNEELPNIYIASFSKGDDLLSQWRAYANDGFGVAIGFNKKYFKKNNLVLSCDVLYDESIQEEEISALLKPLEQLPDNIDIESIEFEKKAKDIINQINDLSAKSKNELFKEENEVRLIHSPFIKDDKENKRFIFENKLSRLKFRPTCGNLIPYFEFPFDNNENEKAIVEIVKGPKNKFIEKEIKMFLSLNGFYDVRIRKSRSSYR